MSKVNLGSRAGGDLSGVDLFEMAEKSVFRIVTKYGSLGQGHGTAFVYKQTLSESGSDLYLLTNLHNFDGPLGKYPLFVAEMQKGKPAEQLLSQVSIMIGDQQFEVDRIVAARGALTSHARKWIHDFAVCSIRTSIRDNLKLFAIPSGDEVRAGEAVFALGFPQDTDLGITEGMVSHVYGADDGKSEPGQYGDHEWQIQHSVLINKGNSGGPTVDKRGSVVGMSTWGDVRPGVTGINYSINVARVFEILRSSEEIEEVNIAKIYSRLIDLAAEEARYGR